MRLTRAIFIVIFTTSVFGQTCRLVPNPFTGLPDCINPNGGGGGGDVASVFGRTGAVAAQTGDYTAAQVTNAVSTASSYNNPTWITGLDGSKINAGLISPARLGTGTPGVGNFLRGDGSWQPTVTAINSLTGAINLTIGTTGTDIAWSGAILNIPTASATNRGALSAPDWTAFNAKVPSTRQIINGTGITGGGDLSADRTLSVVANTTNQQVRVANNGALVGTRREVNIIPGTNVTLNVSDNSGSDRVDVTINAPAAGSFPDTIVSSTQTLANSTTAIINTSATVNVNSSVGDVTSSATPSITTAGAPNGRRLLVCNIDTTDTIFIQDDSVINSDVFLGDDQIVSIVPNKCREFVKQTAGWFLQGTGTPPDVPSPNGLAHAHPQVNVGGTGYELTYKHSDLPQSPIVIDAATDTLDDCTRAYCVYTLPSGPITLGATIPIIADGISGELRQLINVDSADTLTLPGEGTTLGSNLSQTITLTTTNRSVWIRFDPTLGLWVPVGALSSGGGSGGSWDKYYIAAKIWNTVPGSGFSGHSTAAPTPAIGPVASNTPAWATLNFSSSEIQTVYDQLILPASVATPIKLDIGSSTPATTGSYMWWIQVQCPTNGGTPDPPYAGAQAITLFSDGTANDETTSTLGGDLTLPAACTAGRPMRFKIYRDPSNVSDTVADITRLHWVRFYQ